MIILVLLDDVFESVSCNHHGACPSQLPSGIEFPHVFSEIPQLFSRGVLSLDPGVGQNLISI